MGVNILYKNMDSLWGVLQCSRCKKVVFVRNPPAREDRSYNVYKCCECLVDMVWLDVDTAKIEIEV